MGGTDEKDTPIIRERKDFDLFREMTRRLNEKDRLICAQSTEIISKTEEADRKDARVLVLLDACPLGIIFICSRIIEYVNKRITDITGYAREELEGKNARILYDTADEWDAVGKFQDTISCANSKISVKFRKKSGDLVECELSMTRVVDECDQEFVVLVYSDVC